MRECSREEGVSLNGAASLGETTWPESQGAERKGVRLGCLQSCGPPIRLECGSPRPRGLRGTRTLCWLKSLSQDQMSELVNVLVFSLRGFSVFILLVSPWFQNKSPLKHSSLPQRGRRIRARGLLPTRVARRGSIPGARSSRRIKTQGWGERSGRPPSYLGGDRYA